MGTLGDFCDNPIIEWFSARKQTELLDRKKWVTIVEMSTEIVDYIDTFQNHQQRHSSLDMVIPTEYENLHAPCSN